MEQDLHYRHRQQKKMVKINDINNVSTIEWSFYAYIWQTVDIAHLFSSLEYLQISEVILVM